MKLVMLSHYFDDHRGGVEIVAGALAAELALQGFEVAWLATGQSPTMEHGGENPRPRALAAWNVLESTIGIPYPLLFPSAWRAIMAEAETADIILVHDALYMTSVAAFLAARRFGKPLLVVQHIGIVPYRNPTLRALMMAANRLIVKPILARAQAVVFISELTARYFADIRWRRTPSLIFNGVDTTIFVPPASDHEVQEAREILGLSDADRIVLFIGRFVEKKGLPILERLARARPDILFAFAGWGALDPSSWHLPNVRVFRQLSGASLAPLYRASDVLVLPSVGEGFPLVIQEALACGLGVVCGADTAAADPSATRFLTAVDFDSRDCDGAANLFAEALDATLARPGGAAERAQRSKFAHSRYSRREMAVKYAAILQELTKVPSRTKAPEAP